MAFETPKNTCCVYLLCWFVCYCCPRVAKAVVGSVVPMMIVEVRGMLFCTFADVCTTKCACCNGKSRGVSYASVSPKDGDEKVRYRSSFWRVDEVDHAETKSSLLTLRCHSPRRVVVRFHVYVRA
ncbi:unnamed protein product [Ectocarpus sp. 4 AP-2014]